jgi:curved DNA-binding protein CbpA
MTDDGDSVDLYGMLGVSRDATTREIRRAYRRLARQHHPDLNASPDGPQRFAALAHAYEILHDPTQRARYDHTLAPSSPGRPRVGRRPAWPVPSDDWIVARGSLELSAHESAHVAGRPLVLRDAQGQTIMLPAGTRHGDEITVLHGGHRVVLTVRMHARP